MLTYQSTTDQIAVTVRPCYLDEASSLFERQFTFGLSMDIVNRGADEVEVVQEYLYIQDALGGTQEDTDGPSSNGHPTIGPGGRHRTLTTCVIPTFQGSVEGSFLLETVSGERFRANVPLVLLRALVN